VAPPASPVCSSGDCEWPLYGTLGLCSEVINLTAHGNETLLSSLRNVVSQRLPAMYNSTLSLLESLAYGNFAYSTVPLAFPIVLGPLTAPSGVFNESVNSLIASDHYIAYSNERMNLSSTPDLSRIQFLEIAFWWCTKTFATHVSAGVASSVEVATHSRLKHSIPQTLNMGWSDAFYPCYVAGTCNTTFGALEAELEGPDGADPNDNFTIHVWTELTASALLAATMFDSILMDQMRGVIASFGGGIAKTFALSILGDFLATRLPSPETQLSNVRVIARNMATTMTNLYVPSGSIPAHQKVLTDLNLIASARDPPASRKVMPRRLRRGPSSHRKRTCRFTGHGLRCWLPSWY
jgi:hypothetical protein